MTLTPRKSNKIIINEYEFNKILIFGEDNRFEIVIMGVQPRKPEKVPSESLFLIIRECHQEDLSIQYPLLLT